MVKKEMKKEHLWQPTGRQYFPEAELSAQLEACLPSFSKSVVPLHFGCHSSLQPPPTGTASPQTLQNHIFPSVNAVWCLAIPIWPWPSPGKSKHGLSSVTSHRCSKSATARLSALETHLWQVRRGACPKPGLRSSRSSRRESWNVTSQSSKTQRQEDGCPPTLKCLGSCLNWGISTSET